MAQKKDYFGLEWIVSLILAIIPITSCVLGILTRLQEGKFVAAILRLVLGWNIIWILDILLVFKNQRILRVIDM
ncbi:MAG: hypothetical protein E7372_02600 [Clostridiales bacterium]|nr:hypothetical protein [Clostridiales bacterium]